MIKKILIANRGEIAVRIIRTCKEMNIKTVAIYSEADKDAMHVKFADESVCIGPSSSKDSYLNIPNILSACVLTGADAIHPGFGFLSENSAFAKMCSECNIKFIGPSYDVIELMGNKSQARKTMKKAGIPVVDGFEDNIENVDKALEIAENIGFPVIIKAAAGGGGKGIRIVYKKEDFNSLYLTAQTEAKSSFGDDSMYIEKYIEHPKHIEVQIVADNHGNIISLGERECSAQRKNQKVLEEAPSAVINEETRNKMCKVAREAAKAVNYSSLGTIEFLYDNNNFYFMEMNTRIQVEHPITEYITGVDLVKEQIKIANNEKLELKQEDIKLKGHAIECRINAEDPDNDFRPCPGVINEIIFPGGFGVRNDSAIYSGYKIPSFYDSMIGKLIVHGQTRTEAITRMKRALNEYIINGVNTNINYQKKILNSKEFLEGTYDTSFLGKKLVSKSC